MFLRERKKCFYIWHALEKFVERDFDFMLLLLLHERFLDMLFHVALGRSLRLDLRFRLLPHGVALGDLLVKLRHLLVKLSLELLEMRVDVLRLYCGF